ncbi:hydroxymyristoyl-ACP dehydratase [Christiangramia aquimixticola]|uniref:hydroxymyristoyl-ACP dehydratase n=1 Tax=Christiangramia aquimixticola TaxID=1697558 RepID=UPI003AA7AD17
MVLKDFYSVTNTVEEDGLYTTTIKVNGKHEIYNGHFPSRPVTPGVVLMLLFKENAERILDRKLHLKRAENVKFAAVFDPNQCELLNLESKFEENGEFVSLKGIAKNENGIVLKINALYSVL